MPLLACEGDINALSFRGRRVELVGRRRGVGLRGVLVLIQEY